MEFQAKTTNAKRKKEGQQQETGMRIGEEVRLNFQALEKEMKTFDSFFAWHCFFELGIRPRGAGGPVGI
jgi:hypothetical protein